MRLRNPDILTRRRITVLYLMGLLDQLLIRGLLISGFSLNNKFVKHIEVGGLACPDYATPVPSRTPKCGCLIRTTQPADVLLYFLPTTTNLEIPRLFLAYPCAQLSRRPTNGLIRRSSPAARERCRTSPGPTARGTRRPPRGEVCPSCRRVRCVTDEQSAQTLCSLT